MSHFEIVVDTGASSGNYEREMCAYVTGVVDPHGYRGSGIARLFSSDNGMRQWWKDNILFVPYLVDEYTVDVPVDIRHSMATKMCSAVVFAASIMPSSDEIMQITQRAEYFCNHYAEILRQSGVHPTHRQPEIPFIGVVVQRAKKS